MKLKETVQFLTLKLGNSLSLRIICYYEPSGAFSLNRPSTSSAIVITYYDKDMLRFTRSEVTMDSAPNEMILMKLKLRLLMKTQ